MKLCVGVCMYVGCVCTVCMCVGVYQPRIRVEYIS